MHLTKPEQDYVSLVREAKKRGMTVQEYTDSLCIAYGNSREAFSEAPEYKGTKKSQYSQKASVIVLVFLLIALIALLSVVVVSLFSRTSGSTTELQNTLHEIAELARDAGLPEDNPIIVEAQRIYAAEDEPAPSSAVLTQQLSLDRPANGKVFSNGPTSEAYVSLTVHGAKNADTFVLFEYELKAADNEYESLLNNLIIKEGSHLLKFYVRAGETVTIDAPMGKARLYYAAGNEWYGQLWKTDIRFFGEDTVFYTSDDVFDFENYTYEITLYPVPGGNFDTYEIDPEDFPG